MATLYTKRQERLRFGPSQSLVFMTLLHTLTCYVSLRTISVFEYTYIDFNPFHSSSTRDYCEKSTQNKLKNYNFWFSLSVIFIFR